MFLHIGKELIINEKSILGIFDVNSIKDNKEFQNLIKNLEEKNSIFFVDETEKKSFILVENIGVKGYFSSISSVSLSKRLL